MTAATQVDLFGYTIELQRSPTMLWKWNVTALDGDQFYTTRIFLTREEAEADVLVAVEKHARGELSDVTLSGEELRNRVQGNTP